MLTNDWNGSPSAAPRGWRLGTACSFILLCGCTSVETQSFRKADSASVESAQIAVNADFGVYDRLQPEDLGIYFLQNAALSAADIARLRQIFRTAFLAELGGYRIVDRPGPGTLKVQASLIDLRNAAATELPNLRRDVRDIATPGNLVFLMELRDSRTDRVLARAADSTRTPAITSADGSTSTWPAVESAAAYWASLFRQFLDENLAPDAVTR